VMESALQGCDCGGRFRGDAARRCFDCAAVVELAAGKDLMPDFGADLDADRAQVQWDEFAAKFLGEGRWAADQKLANDYSEAAKESDVRDWDGAIADGLSDET
jgi:hypothetical protein